MNTLRQDRGGKPAGMRCAERQEQGVYSGQLENPRRFQNAQQTGFTWRGRSLTSAGANRGLSTMRATSDTGNIGKIAPPAILPI
jgi:hypothetical protein